MKNITLQISLSASDLRHVIYLLPHQIKVFEKQVDEILLTYDTHKSKGHFGQNWESNNEKMWKFLQEISLQNKKIKLIKISYSKEKKAAVAKAFFHNRQNIPAKDWRGGPFFTYFFGLFEAKNEYVFHIDSDMFFGGLSQSWLNEAIALYEQDPSILFINPLPGPPKENGKLVNQVYFNYKDFPYHFGFNAMSTRLFLVSKTRFKENSLLHIRTRKIGQLIRALYKGNPPFKLPEEIISEKMQEEKMIRVDFLGTNLGLWSLHPPYRTEQFYIDLPKIISRIELNDVPESQKGFYDIVDELVDWAPAKSKLKI